MLAASLAAHLGVLAAWMSTRPDLHFVEPSTVQVELVRPPPRLAPKPVPQPRPSERRSETVAPAPPTFAPPAPPPPPITPPPPRTVDPRLMTDQELLARSGARPDIARLHAKEALEPVFSRRLGRPPPGEEWMAGGCKPMSEHSNRNAPPCKVGGADDLASRTLGDHDPSRNGFAAEARYKDAVKAYKEAPGAAGYPGIACAVFHKC